MSPSLGIGIGLGYVTLDHSKLDSEIFIQIRKKALAAKVVKLPFYKG
jgi:aminomethyltransferase